MDKDTTVSVFLIILLIFITLGVVLYCQYPALKERLIAHCDINTYIFPIYSLQNRKLFKNDLLTQYVLSTQIPKGYLALFLFLGNFFDIVFCFNILPSILTTFSVICLFVLGKNIKNNLAGFAMSFLFLMHCWTFHTFQGTSPRAFAYPLLIPFIYSLIKRKYIICFFLYLIQIFFYPPIALISLLTLFFALIETKDYKLYIKLKPPLVLILFISTILFPLANLFQFGANSRRIFGRVATLPDMFKMSEFYPGGRDPFFFNNIWQFLASSRAGVELNSPLIFILTVLLALFLILKKIKNDRFLLAREIKCLLLASFILYLLAFFLLLRLFFPARYLVFTIPFVICVSIGVLFSNLVGTLKNRSAKNKTVIAFILFIVLFYLPRINGRLQDYLYLKEVISYLSKVAEDSVIASIPPLSDPIPTFAKRKVLFSRRLLLPFYLGYYDKVKKRAFDFFDAYYSDSIQPVREFCHKYSVDYIVLNKRHFCPEFFKSYTEDEPFNSYIQEITKSKKNFFLPNIDKSRIVFEKDDFVIIKTSDFKSKENTPG